jgi:hypothetical protein
MSVLTETELANLLKVPTTVEGALQIRERNEKLLEFLDEIPTTVDAMNAALNEVGNYCVVEEVDIGCSHCNGDLVCATCVYRHYPEEELRLQPCDMHRRPLTAPCLDVLYGGLTANDLSRHDREVHLSYDADDATLTTTVDGPVDEDDMVEVNRQIQEVATVLTGHIEWADAVIVRGGVEEPSSV